MIAGPLGINSAFRSVTRSVQKTEVLSFCLPDTPPALLVYHKQTVTAEHSKPVRVYVVCGVFDLGVAMLPYSALQCTLACGN